MLKERGGEEMERRREEEEGYIETEGERRVTLQNKIK